MLNNLYWLSTEIFIAVSIIVILTHAVIYQKKGYEIKQNVSILNLAVVVTAISAIMYAIQINTYDPIYVSLQLINITPLTQTIKMVLSISTGIVLILSKDTFTEKTIKDYELVVLINLALLGMLLLVSSHDLVIFYLSIELFSLSIYILAAINRNSEYSTEAGLKYFVLGSLSSGLLLFGSSLLYIFTGETNFNGILNMLWYNGDNVELKLALLFIFVALLFKLAAAPFHMWAPDVYDGAPNIVTAFFAIVPKLATIGIFINILWFATSTVSLSLQPVLITTSILSLLIGSIGAINQTKIKRLIAYSAISHIGFMLLGILVYTAQGINATIIYNIIYIIMGISAFSIILVCLKKTTYISELSGLSRKNPLLALSFSTILFSIAGIPPLAGFFSKYIVLVEAIGQKYYLLSLIAVLASSIATFYYIRIIKWMYFKDSTDFYIKDLADVIKPTFSVDLKTSVILGLTIFLILTLLIYPDFLITIINLVTIESIK